MAGIDAHGAGMICFMILILFYFFFLSHPIYYLRPSFLSLVVVTQVRGRIAGSSPPFSLRLVPFVFIARRLKPFLPSSIRVEWQYMGVYIRAFFFCCALALAQYLGRNYGFAQQAPEGVLPAALHGFRAAPPLLSPCIGAKSF